MNKNETDLSDIEIIETPLTEEEQDLIREIEEELERIFWNTYVKYDILEEAVTKKEEKIWRD